MEELSAMLGRALWTALVLSLLPLGASMLVGFVVSVLQAATQVQEQTLSFVPKLLTVILVVVFFGEWAAEHAVDFTADVLAAAATRGW